MNQFIDFNFMLEQISPLWSIYLRYKQQDEPLVLATLIETQGSSYKKAGAMMLIEPDRTTHGLLSGGCLENDVAEHALQVFESKAPLHLIYDLSDESIFGLGAGCDGIIHIVLQLINQDYLPFSALNPLPQKAEHTELLIASGDHPDFPLGNYFIKKNQQVIESMSGIYTATKTSTQTLNYSPPPRVVIFGTGTDTLPLCQLLKLLHWHVTVVDHRKIKLKQLQNNEGVNTLSPENLNAKNFNHDAMIIMTHNLERDAQYLKFAAETKCEFIGLLGPPNRRDKVLVLADLSKSDFNQRLKAPVGLNLGGRMPENIALAICAQLQAFFYQ